ncbi:extracellular solute-binding protein, partial [Corynebacterium sp. CCM 8862]
VNLNLLVPSYSDDTKSLWENIISGFEADNPNIKVNLQVESWENINDVMRNNVQANKMPDILNIDSFTDYAREDLLYPADEVVSPDTLSDIQQSFRDNASMDGTQWGLPLIASARALYYNKDLFEQAGISEPPATWEELEKDALAIKALDLPGVDGYGMPLGNEEAQAETAVWFFGAGGSYTDGKEITIDTPENLEGATFMKKLIDEGATQANPGSSQRTPLGKTFFQGKVGMVVGLPQYKKLIEEQNPDLNYALAAIPTKDGSAMTLGVADHLMAFDLGDDAKKEAITKFLDYFYSVDVYSNFVSTLGFIPVTKSAGEKLASDETIKEFIPLLPNAKFYPFTNPNWQTAQGAIQANIGRIQTEDPKTVLETIQTQTDQG